MLYPRYSVWPYYVGLIGDGGLGLYYDPFWLGAGSYPYASNFPYGSLWYSSPGYAPYPFDQEGPTGGLRLKVEPKEAVVYVDGYDAGIVDDFNGHFQHLDLTPGPHHVEIRAPGRQSLTLDINIQAHHTTEYRGTLLPVLP